MRILVPVDLSEESAPIVRYAAGLAVRTGAELIVLHVYSREAAVTALREEGLFIDLYIGRLRSEANFLKAHAAVAGQQARVEVVEGDAVDVILSRAGELHADLIVMGTHRRAGLSRLLMGSVAEGVLRRATCPVLLLPLQILAAPSRESAPAGV